MKNKLVFLSFGLIFYFIIIGIGISEFFQSLFILIVSNVILDYFYEIHVVSKKVLAIQEYQDNFNSDYFDLYWSLSKNRIQLVLNVVFFSISFVNFIKHQENFVTKSIWAIVFFFIGYFIWACLLCQIGKNQKIIFYLMSKKQQDYSAYKDNELEIIRELK